MHQLMNNGNKQVSLSFQFSVISSIFMKSLLAVHCHHFFCVYNLAWIMILWHRARIYIDANENFCLSLRQFTVMTCRRLMIMMTMFVGRKKCTNCFLSVWNEELANNIKYLGKRALIYKYNICFKRVPWS